MAVLDEMMQIRRELLEQDRRRAMEALTELLHYKVASRVTGGDSFVVFRDENAVAAFCRENELDGRALSWLFESMKNEGLTAPGTASVTLTPLGVEKFCLSD